MGQFWQDDRASDDSLAWAKHAVIKKYKVVI
jgi:hypothetical protein